MSKQRSTLTLVIALVVLVVIIAFQHSINTKMRDQLEALTTEQRRQVEQDEVARQERIKSDGERVMRAICTLGEFAQSDRDADSEQALTIRSAEFELLYFSRTYLNSIPAGRPMFEMMFTGPLSLEEWHIRGEYYSTPLKATSVSLEAAKASTMANITPDGEIRYLLERIHRRMERYQNSKQGDAPKT